jgi:outer membrane immunogenic protein
MRRERSREVYDRMMKSAVMQHQNHLTRTASQPRALVSGRGLLSGIRAFALAAFVVLLLVAGSTAGRAQESRQDVSVSGSVDVEPFVSSSTDVKVSANRALGGLVSYRFMLTPRGAVEGNYSYQQNHIHYVAPSYNYQVNTRMQEATAAYVYNFNFRKFNPFVEAGGGALMFTNLRNLATTTLDVKSQTIIAGLYGVGVAYEISPSFDIRLEYRGFISKVPNFGYSPLNTNKYYNIYDPVIGVAYHF